jgi:hypothetical protein
MILNALIRRYAVSALRPQHLWVNISIYGIGVGLIAILNTLALRTGAYDGDVRLCLRSIYGQLLVIQFLLLWIWGGHGAGNVLREEMLNKSYDFFRMLPLSPGQKLMGVSVGRNLLPLALAAATSVVQLLVGLAGGVPVFLQMQIALVLIATTVLVWSVSVLSSVREQRGKRQQRGVSAMAMIFLALWIVPGIFQLMLITGSVTELYHWTISFFGVDVPGILLVGLIAMYLGGWSSVGAMRQLSRSDQPIFNASGAYGFLVGCLVIILGLFWQGLSGREPMIWIAYAAATHTLLFCIPFGVLRSYEQYMELTYNLARQHGDGRALHRVFLRSVNPATWGGLYALWAVFTVGASARTSVDAMQWALMLVVCVFFAWAVCFLLVEIAVVGTPRNEKLKYFAGFLIGVYVVLPMVLAGVLDEELLFSFSFFGVWKSIGEHSPGTNASLAGLLFPLILNVLLVFALVMIVRHRYAHIIQMRRAMLSRHAPGESS